MKTSIAILQDEHRSIAAVLKGLLDHVARIRSGTQEPDFALFLNMFEYIETLPEKIHHPKENDYLFRLLRMRDPLSAPLLDELEAQHESGAEMLADLQKKLREYQNGGTLAAFDQALSGYAEFNWDHMRKEETLILPRAEQFLTESDWKLIDDAFAVNRNSAW